MKYNNSKLSGCVKQESLEGVIEMLNKNIPLFGDASSDRIFVQMVDEHDLKLMEGEIAAIKEYTNTTDWCLAVVPVRNWNQDLTPWKAAPVFGRQGFGDGAEHTLREVLESVIPSLGQGGSSHAERRYYLCGYSLAGLFALWAGYRTNSFAGIVAASPSVWYPDWIDYARAHRIQSPAVYLSLGDREEKTKNPVMATVGNAIREMHEILKTSCASSCLEWNPGNHFADSDRRLAKGIAWMLNRGKLQ